MKRIDTDRYRYNDMVYDAYYSVLPSIPEGRTVKFMLKAILSDGVEELVLLFYANVKLLSLYESEDRVVPLYIYAVDVCELPTTDYTVNGPWSIMAKPSQRQLRRMGAQQVVRQLLLSQIGRLRDSGKTKTITRTDSENQGSTGISSASADDSNSRPARKLAPIVDLKTEDELIPHFESSDEEWKEDDEGSIHSSDYSDNENGDGFGACDTEGERGGVSEREAEQIEGEGDEVNGKKKKKKKRC
ncbi:hypothetical protein NE237_016633 [Protea cynaroides]|uniref:Uncharacterized protein n=1 Tax=Protea cynaroides TaxID=273540 RepID=A0A9Q0HF65_9MAGN|nr:hypothetical protein NE237_016633 [Protea cynaroides]